MIYFDSNKQAYAYEIPNYIAAIDDQTWSQYANSKKWDIIDGIFTDITSTPAYITELAQELQAQNNANILAQIADLEQKSLRGLRDAFLRQDTTHLAQYDEHINSLRGQLTA